MSNELEKGVVLCPPNPEYLIKSIAEQGYSLETAFADLIDNSISAEANRIEILSANDNNITIFITDDGNGMDLSTLFKAMSIPSSSVDSERDKRDLGRFGLGMKTASFSQTRSLTVVSRYYSNGRFNGYSWDVDYLKKTGDWTIKRLSDDEIEALFQYYVKTSESHLNRFENYLPNTLVVWNGLYKYENYLKGENRISALNSDFSNNVEEHISIAFHRFLENKIKIRLNNKLIESFNPFPDNSAVIRLPKRMGRIHDSTVKFEGIVLPYSSIKESKNQINPWTTSKKGLMDMEGIYIYRGDRLISYGGWHGIIKRSGRLQLGRMRIDISNDLDDVLKLNVAKSQIEIPYELRSEFHKSLEELCENARREFYNVGLKEVKMSEKEKGMKVENLFAKVYTNKGTLLYVNERNPLINFMNESFDDEQRKLFHVFLKNINSIFNRNRQFDSDTIIKEEKNKLSLDEIETTIHKLRDKGLDDDEIKEVYLSKILSKEDLNNILP